MQTTTPKKRRKRLITVEGSDAWHDWLEGLSDHIARDKSATIEEALREAAKRWSYEPRPPRR